MSFRVLATGDDHFDQHCRFDECIRVHGWMVELARDAKIDLFLDGGDVYERNSSVIERQAVADWLTPMAEVAPSLLVRGNHDKPGDVAYLRRLRTKHPITVEEGAAVHHIAGAAIAAVAWPERGPLLAATGSLQGTEDAVREALQALFRGLGAELSRHDGPRLGLGHMMIDGSIASTGQPLLGLPINVSLSDLALLCVHLGFVSHIHKAQRFQPPVWGPWVYAGASHRTDFSQIEPKTVVLAEFDGQRLVKVEEIPTPCAPMFHFESTWGGHGLPSFDALRGCDDIGCVVGAEIRWRYGVPADMREQADRAAREWADSWIAQGAKSVKLEPETLVETRARAPEVAAAQTLPDKLEAHWESVGFDPGERRQALLEKAAELEAEVHLAA